MIDKDSVTIVLVDDARSIRVAIKKDLHGEGYTVLEAASGTAGLDLVTSHEGFIDLIIADQNMPGMSGLEMVTAIRALKDNANANCNVLFLTSDNTPALRQACLDLKGLGIILKPAPSLIKLVKKIVSKKKPK
jgi:CheY-like chemotaxis protein